MVASKTKMLACIAGAALVATFGLAACGESSAPSNTSSSSPAATSTTGSSGAAKEVAGLDELRDAMENAPAFKSVTLTSTVVADNDDDTTVVRVLKFDNEGAKPRSVSTFGLGEAGAVTEYYDGGGWRSRRFFLAKKPLSGSRCLGNRRARG